MEHTWLACFDLRNRAIDATIVGSLWWTHMFSCGVVNSHATPAVARRPAAHNTLLTDAFEWCPQFSFVWGVELVPSIDDYTFDHVGLETRGRKRTLRERTVSSAERAMGRQRLSVTRGTTAVVDNLDGDNGTLDMSVKESPLKNRAPRAWGLCRTHYVVGVIHAPPPPTHLTPVTPVEFHLRRPYLWRRTGVAIAATSPTFWAKGDHRS